MKHVKKSVLLWYAPREMYTLVTAVQDYPKFLPWCERAEVLGQEALGMTARLHLRYSGLRHAFTTRNVQEPDNSVRMTLVDGPFSALDGLWRFVPLGMPGSGAEPMPGALPDPDEAAIAQACRVEFDLSYAFSNRAFELALSPVFDHVANTFVDSFVKRAEQVYGER